MSLFGKRATNIAVLDIRTSSIGAGYVVLEKGIAPLLAYSTRTPIATNATEPFKEAFSRTLTGTLEELAKEGGPILRQTTGSGSVDRVLVSYTAPWQESQVYSDSIANEKSFVFTRQLLEDTAKKSVEIPEGRRRVNDLTLATLLNGYEVSNPFGKRVNRAELIMLSTTLDKTIEGEVNKAVRSALHQHKIESRAFMPETYTVFRDLYPHQRDYLVLDVGSESTDLLLVKHGVLVSSISTTHGVGDIARAARGIGVSSPTVPVDSVNILDTTRNSSFASAIATAEAAWVSEMARLLGELAKQEPLPRMVFLLAEENVRDFLRRLLDAPALRALWLSEEALSILPILPGQFSPFLAEKSCNPPDPALALLALAAARG